MYYQLLEAPTQRQKLRQAVEAADLSEGYKFGSYMNEHCQGELEVALEQIVAG